MQYQCGNISFAWSYYVGSWRCYCKGGQSLFSLGSNHQSIALASMLLARAIDWVFIGDGLNASIALSKLVVHFL